MVNDRNKKCKYYIKKEYKFKKFKKTRYYALLTRLIFALRVKKRIATRYFFNALSIAFSGSRVCKIKLNINVHVK